MEKELEKLIKDFKDLKNTYTNAYNQNMYNIIKDKLDNLSSFNLKQELSSIIVKVKYLKTVQS